MFKDPVSVISRQSSGSQGPLPSSRLPLDLAPGASANHSCLSSPINTFWTAAFFFKLYVCPHSLTGTMDTVLLLNSPKYRQ